MFQPHSSIQLEAAAQERKKKHDLLRDQFACVALTGLLVLDGKHDGIAEDAFYIANLMLQERDKHVQHNS